MTNQLDLTELKFPMVRQRIIQELSTVITTVDDVLEVTFIDPNDRTDIFKERMKNRFSLTSAISEVLDAGLKKNKITFTK